MTNNIQKQLRQQNKWQLKRANKTWSEKLRESVLARDSLGSFALDRPAGNQMAAGKTGKKKKKGVS
jgi:hypothetical protein